MRVLVVEDNPDMGRYLEQGPSEHGFAVDLVADTVGEFPPAVVWPEAGQDEARREGENAVCRRPSEFADSIHCYSRARAE
jgi:DNA-binding response OmpR family regulator